MTTMIVGLVTAVVCVALTGAVLSTRQRRRFSRAGETFPCRVRLVAGSPVGWSTRSGNGRARALWVHDVLLVQRGRFLPRVIALPVRLPEDSVRAAEPGEVVSGLGGNPQVIDLRLDDGPLVAVAAADRHRCLLAGPFLVAAVASARPRHT